MCSRPDVVFRPDRHRGVRGPAVGVDVMAVAQFFDPEVVRRWVERWCAAQGVAVKVAELYPNVVDERAEKRAAYPSKPE